MMNLGSIKDKTLRRKTVNRLLTASAVLCTAIVAVTAAVALANRGEQQLVLEAPTATVKPADSQSVEVEKPGKTALPTVPPTASPTPKDDREASTNVTVTKASMLLPLAGGNVLKGYASDRLLYSATLKHWATHTGLDLAASSGTPVLAALDGRVLKVEEDPLMGVTVTLEHDDGLQTVYASLEKAKDGLKAGDSVLRGQEIGTVGASAACEAEDGVHLHFEVFSQGKSVNPQTYLTGLGK